MTGILGPVVAEGAAKAAGAGAAGLGRGPKVLAAALLYAVYLKARELVVARAVERGERVGPTWLGMLAFRLTSAYSHLMGVRVASEGGDGLAMVGPDRRHLIVWHPHGLLAWSPAFLLPRLAIQSEPHGREWFGLVASVVLRIPILSDLLYLMNARSVDKKNVEHLGNIGASIAIQPGGMREQIETRNDQEQAYFPANLGFIRTALRHGMDLLPIYLFNETQLYTRVDGFEGFADWVKAKTGFGVPIITGKFGLPMAGLTPKAADIHIRWGEPVRVEEAVPEPTDEQVEELFCKYLDSLRTLFYKHADECLPPEVAKRGLRIVRMDRKPVPSHPGEAKMVPLSRL